VLKVPAGDEFLRRLRLGPAELDLIGALVEENGLAIPGMEQVDRPLKSYVDVVAVEDQNHVRPGGLIHDQHAAAEFSEQCRPDHDRYEQQQGRPGAAGAYEACVFARG